MIRLATKSDYLAMSKVLQKTWKQTYRGIFSQRFLDKLPENYWVQSLERRKQGINLVAEREGEIVGVLGGGKSRFGEGGEIYALYVLPDFQGQGIGAQLIEEAQRLLQEEFAVLRLNVVDRNSSAQRFYEKMGFYRLDEVLDSQLDGKPFTAYVYEKRLGSE